MELLAEKMARYVEARDRAESVPSKDQKARIRAFEDFYKAENDVVEALGGKVPAVIRYGGKTYCIARSLIVEATEFNLEDR